MTGTIVARRVPLAAERTLAQAGVHPLLSRLFAARGVRTATDLDCDLSALIPPAALKNADAAAALLADHIASGKRLMIVADYDCDGATACAVGLRALAALGAQVDYFVPNRFETGYGLSPQVVDLVAPARPDLIITVDNGIASHDGIAHARALGVATLVTDHHLPADAEVEGPVFIGEGCRIAGGVRLTGPVVIGEGSQIGEGAHSGSPRSSRTITFRPTRSPTRPASSTPTSPVALFRASRSRGWA